MRLIDADALMCRLATWSADLALTYSENDEYVKCLDIVCEKIEEAQTIDAVEIVRCRDCKWLERGCDSPDDDYFCSEAERKV